MSKLSKEDLEDGLDYHDAEDRVFPKIKAKILAKQELDKKDVLHILKWKLGRIKASDSRTISNKNLLIINKAIRSAGVGNGLDALEALMQIHGIKLAVATTILTICYPEKFTIIDFRVLEVLNLFPATTDGWTAQKYVDEFLPVVIKQSEKWNCSLRNADKALWGLSVKRRFEEIL
ncbi:MAG TPA: hypothetical protein VNU94_02920 [Acidobacteriaceae bacterium]|jgi:hypothetical protein|nr:hypothetical protein [Acidobacteriaceae bacterium]